MKEQIRHYKTDEVEAQDRCWKELMNVTFRAIIDLPCTKASGLFCVFCKVVLPFPQYCFW